MKFRKKPVVIEAIKWTGKNKDEIVDFFKNSNFSDYDYSYRKRGEFAIETLEGVHFTSVGDWIIKGIAGEFYPCKPEIFDETYEKVLE